VKQPYRLKEGKQSQMDRADLKEVSNPRVKTRGQGRLTDGEQARVKTDLQGRDKGEQDRIKTDSQGRDKEGEHGRVKTDGQGRDKGEQDRIKTD
jgi:hypothetical protein